MALGIWIGAADIHWGEAAPFAQPEKRIYIIALLYLVWLLKFLVLDLSDPDPLLMKDMEMRKKCLDLQNRFHSAQQFLKKTTVAKLGKSLRLSELPLHLLIGPSNAGKTAMLANSGVNYVLHRQFQKVDSTHITSSESCDWWLTRDANIIDVPGKYLQTPHTPKKRFQKSHDTPVMWRFLLHLIKKYHGKHGIDNIIIALPLPEMMLENDHKKNQAILFEVFQRLSELHKTFPGPIPCQFVITKTDLLPGFSEFFAESSQDELTQAWGIIFSDRKAGEKSYDLFAERFNALIKKLNQQLLWRLHHERNPLARPAIKDFPLQIERLKEFTRDVIKKFSALPLSRSLQSVYLTSALQDNPVAEMNVLEEAGSANMNAVQIFKEPSFVPRSYFIKQFITHGLNAPLIYRTNTKPQALWPRRTAYAMSASVIIVAAVMLGRDFEQGIKHAYSIQGKLSDYQLAIQPIENPDAHLIKTANLLKSLQEAALDKNVKPDLSNMVQYYSYQSHQKANAVYYQALQSILVPEIKNYLVEYLKNPVNKNAGYVYAAFKAYLMLGDATHMQPPFVVNTMEVILPKTIEASDRTQLLNQMQTALSTNWKPLQLDNYLIQETRKYFLAMPNFQLAYIILKNINNNNSNSDINLGINNENPIFFTSQSFKPIPNMFTAKAFPNIVAQQITAAAQEAIIGNWVLANGVGTDANSPLVTALIDQLRTAYINNYIELWENVLNNVRINSPNDLTQTDKLIVNLVSNDSPMLQILRTVHENTNFDPITSTSRKLQNLKLLLDKQNREAEVLLYQIFSGLQALHQYIQTVLSAENERKSAFNLVSLRMQHQGTPDAITQLRLIAAKSPEPVKSWLDKITDSTWRYLLQDAGRYLDISWQEQVIRPYQNEIADRYPFSMKQGQEVSMTKFIEFFGNPGVIVNFYNNYLQAFIDTKSAEWHWKSIDNERLVLSDETLRQIQHAMRIHRTFFPNSDNKLYVQFTLQPYQFSKNIKSVTLSINEKQFVDQSKDVKSTSKSLAQHMIAWPNNNDFKMTSVQFDMANKKTIKHNFPGDWGWFKLVNQAFDSVITKKEILINFSMNENPAKYLLFIDEQHNPFLSLNLKHFSLPPQLTTSVDSAKA